MCIEIEIQIYICNNDSNRGIYTMRNKLNSNTLSMNTSSYLDPHHNMVYRMQVMMEQYIEQVCTLVTSCMCELAKVIYATMIPH